jgi:membrane-anchored protein YejM (alkaline phosphatase superfamily)
MQKSPASIRLFFLFNYVLMAFIVSDSMNFSALWSEHIGVFTFGVLSFLLYCLFYLLPAIGLSALAQKFSRTPSSRLISATAIISFGLSNLLMYANAKIFSLYGMFFNGFILNLVLTPGGIESLGGSNASHAGFAVIILGFFGLSAGLWWLSQKLPSINLPLNISKRLSWAVAIIAVVIHLAYAFDTFTKNQLHPVAESIPFFQTISARNFFKTLGFKPQRDTSVSVKSSGKLNYPLNPLQINAPKQPYNIVWLTSESLRWDMLDQRIMPNTWGFSSQAARFTQNYSGGNGTRMGVFTMFTGIPGNYWFNFLDANRGAAIIDVMQQQQYQMSLYTSAKFSYPEFSKTIFARIPSSQLHDQNHLGTGWENDRENVSQMLNFIDQRDKNKPFFTFMFFESPHARYYFPPESVIAKPYRDDINYATIDKKQFKEDIVPIKNRYINAVHHLDSQFGRIFDYLKQHDLLNNTIVVINGDHGEEFMEHGFWGHNSTFVDQQTRTPLVIYVPQMNPMVSDDMTSHMDIVPTLMPLLGVSNPTSDYAIGYNLLKGEKRTHTYISDWDKVTYIDAEVKITYPVNQHGVAGVKVSNKDDSPVSNESASALQQSKQAAITQMIMDLSKFFKRKSN